jgi:tRNA (guanine37-N1)-methyltransferase
MSPSLKESLKGKIPDDLLVFVKQSFDSVGSIAVIEIPDELLKFEKIIADSLLDNIKNIKTVLKKVGVRSGRFRRIKLKWLAGKRTKITEHKENSCMIRLNVETCYFSPRLSHERLRIAEFISPDERVLVAFGGVAPYALIFAKKSKAKEIVSVELNPAAHFFADENVRINKFQSRIKLVNGDVSKVVSDLGIFDRVIMAMPKGGEKFLEFCIPSVKKGGFLHYYDFGSLEEFDIISQKVVDACKKLDRDCEILAKIKAGDHAPRIYRVCIDVKIL